MAIWLICPVEMVISHGYMVFHVSLPEGNHVYQKGFVSFQHPQEATEAGIDLDELGREINELREDKPEVFSEPLGGFMWLDGRHM